MIAKVRDRINAFKAKLTALMDDKPLTAACVFAGVGAEIGVAIGVALA